MLPKAPPLRKCKNPNCDGYFYGYRNQQYCDVCGKERAKELRKKHSKAWFKRKKSEQKANL